MRLTKILAATASLSLAAAPALADTNPASALSLTHSARAGGHGKHKSELLGGGIIIAVVAAAAVAAGVAVVASNSSSN